MTTPLRDEDVELRRLLIKSIGDGFTIYVSSTTKAYQEGDDRRTAPGFIADAVLEALADRLLPPVISERVEWRVATVGVVWPCGDEGAAWRKYGELRAEPEKWSEVKIERRLIQTFDDGSERIYRWEEAE